MTHSGGYDEEYGQVEGIFLDCGCREEEEASEGSQGQSENDTGLVAVLLHEHRYGDGENEVSQPVGALSERGCEGIEFASLHHLPDHGRQKVAAYSPQEEKREDQAQRKGGIVLFVLFHTLL